MATTVLQGFRQLRSNLEITGLQEHAVSTRQNNVRAAVETDLVVLDSFLTGSYRRNTLIAPLKEADVDIFVVLDSSYYKSGGQAWLLDKVRSVLKKTYPSTPRISRNGQAVTITFKDFVVDVVPAFYRNGGGYLIADSTSARWISTDPKKHIEIWSSENRWHDGNLVPVIKMIKAWNKGHSALLRSFHLEALVVAILHNVTIPDDPSGVRYVFDTARQAIRYPLPDPAGYGGDVGDYLRTQNRLAEVLSRVEAAYGRAVEAEQYERLGHTERAIERWRLVFGDYFPAYG